MIGSEWDQSRPDPSRFNSATAVRKPVLEYRCPERPSSCNRSLELTLARKFVSKLTRRLLPFLFVLYIVNYLDRINVGFAALQMRGQLGFSDKVYGLGAGIFFAGYFFFQVPSNLALARVGARKWIAVIMVLWGTVSASMIFVTYPAKLLPAALSVGSYRSGIFSWNHSLSEEMVSISGAGARGGVVHDGKPAGRSAWRAHFRRAPRSTRSASGGMAVVVPDRRTAGSSAGRRLSSPI